MRRINRGTGQLTGWGWKAIAAVFGGGHGRFARGVPWAAAQQQQDTARVTNLVEHVDRVLTTSWCATEDRRAHQRGQAERLQFSRQWPQTIRTFDFQNVDEAVTRLRAKPSPALHHQEEDDCGPGEQRLRRKPDELKDRRLIVMFFDLACMQPEDIERGSGRRQGLHHNHMAPADWRHR